MLVDTNCNGSSCYLTVSVMAQHTDSHDNSIIVSLVVLVRNLVVDEHILDSD